MSLPNGAKFLSLAGLVVIALAVAPAQAAKRVRRPDRSFEVPTGELGEVSGCAVSQRLANTVWLHNDSGDSPRLFRLNTVTKAVRKVAVSGAEAVDWEDIAALPNGDLLIADIGDNAKKRDGVVLYQVPEPARLSRTVAATARRLRYVDGPHNAEALVVDPANGTPYVITKEESGVASVYGAGGDTLKSVGTITIDGESLFFPNLITGADALPDGSAVVLRTYQFGYVLARSPGKPFTSAFSATPKKFALPFMLQAEAICALGDSRSVFTTTESRGEKSILAAVISLP